MPAAHDPRLLAIDPPGCGCTECLTGEYRPLQDATDDDIRALFAGEINDNTSERWDVEQTSSWEDEGFSVYVNGRSIDLPTITLPLPVGNYRIALYKEVFERVACNEGTYGATG